MLLRLQVVFTLACGAGTLWAQACPCGSSPASPPAVRTQAPYARTPEDLRPFGRFTKPYYEHYTKTPEYTGAAAEAPVVSAAGVSEVPIGFLGPVSDHKDVALGIAMRRGAEMAVREANARGGYCGKPFRLIVHNDAAAWGASSNEIVKMVYDEKVWAMLGSISGDSTHIALRVSLRAELPMVNSASTDPTIPETIIPWILTSIQDDRVQCYTLARRIYSDLGLKRIGLLRVNERYGRFGVMKFRDAARRLGHPVVIEQKFAPLDTSFTRLLRVINDSRVDGVVLWGDAAAAGTILKEMRQMGMKQPVFGSFRVLGDELLRIAGPAAEGLEIAYPFDPNREDPAWIDFQKRFAAAYQAKTDAFSALGFDTMNILLGAICRAGLNRGLIRDALYSVERYRGVTGEMSFDPNAKNIAPMFLGTVKNGKFEFRRYSMEKPYATVGASGVSYDGPEIPDATGRKLKIGLFGPGADKLAASLATPGYEVVGIASDQQWGKASTELVALAGDRALVGIVAVGREPSHLAGQIAVKTFVPVLAVSSDRTLTSANIPWIFRVGVETAAADAVRLLASAATVAGPNRQRIRGLLASGTKIAGRYQFAANGEPR